MKKVVLNIYVDMQRFYCFHLFDVCLLKGGDSN